MLPRAGYRPHGVAAILALSGYEPPEVIRRIATDRSTPYVHRELKRTRHRIRYSDVKNAPIYKSVYMREEYAVGSTQGGILQPIQQHTWEVLWATADPHEGFNVLFTVHPYAEPYELGMYFAEEPDLLAQAVVQHEKNTYDKPDKWTGSSPFEQVVQHEDVVVVLYDIAPGTRYEHVSGYFSRTLQGLEERESGWIVARGGDALIAYFPLAPFEWRDEPGGDRRLHSSYRKNGAVVQVAPARDYASLDAFTEAVEALPLETTTEPTPSVRFTTLRGARLDVTYDEIPRVNGEPVDYDAWPLFGGPFMQAERDSRRLELRHGDLRRTLDFTTLTVTDAHREDVAPQSMNALYYPEWDTLTVTERPRPAVEADEVLLRVAACGICGSELETFKARSERRTPPLIMGHEFCGTIEAVGSDVRDFAVGRPRRQQFRRAVWGVRPLPTGRSEPLRAAPDLRHAPAGRVRRGRSRTRALLARVAGRASRRGGVPRRAAGERRPRRPTSCSTARLASPW